jgi:hypothetical protein
MTIKRFKSFLEQNIAADYVAPADDDEEVKDYKPRSKGEEKFKNLHKVEVTPHPVAKKHQHTAEETAVDEVMFPGSPEYKAKFDPKYNKYDPNGEMRKKLALKPYGDREDPEDSPVSNQTKGRGRPRKYADKNEEVEPIDELSKSTLASYAKKASHDARIKMATGKDFERISITSKKPAYKASAQDWENKYKSDARRREAGVNRAIDKLAKEEVELEEEVMSDLKKIVEKKQVMNVKFTNGRTEEVDLNTAKAILELHNRVDEQNKMKIERMVNSSPTNFMKVVDIAMGGK